jgi:hypothetical protein
LYHYALRISDTKYIYIAAAAAAAAAAAGPSSPYHHITISPYQ